MKTISLPSLLLSSVLITSVAAAASPILLDPVGPEANRVDRAAVRGVLMVYSGVEVQQRGNDSTDTYTHRSNYEIWSADASRRVAKVRNASPLFVADEGPTRVELVPGQYRVKAMANAYSWVDVPVIIAANRVTAVHLDGSLGVDKTRSSSEKIYLPDGEIVGSRATELKVADRTK
jgi:hypothetical protein